MARNPKRPRGTDRPSTATNASVQDAYAVDGHNPVALKKGTISMTWPVFALVLALTLVVGLIAGSFAAKQEVVVHQQVQQAPAQQSVTQAPAQSPPQPQQAIPRETLERISELERTVLADPKNRQALVDLGHLYFDTQQHRNAIQAYENALALDGNDADVLTDLGVMYRAENEFDKAVACFEKAQQIEPGHRISLYNKGVVLYFDLHRHEDGIRTWEELLALDPNQKTPNGSPLTDLIRQAKESAHAAN